MNKRGKKISQSVLTECIYRYRSGESLATVAASVGVTRQAVWSKLRNAGVKMRSQRRRGSANNFFRGGRRSSDKTHNLTEKALINGQLKRSLACEKCAAVGAEKRDRYSLVAHHDDYNRPLSVRWLCRKCHRAWHATHRAIPRRRSAA